MRPLALALLAVAVATAAPAGTADAKKKKTYCQKAVSAFKGTKVEARKGGITVYRQSRTINACSDKKRFAAGLYVMDPGYKVAKVLGAKSRCLTILFTAPGKLPIILFKDLAGKSAGSQLNIIGFGQPAATVGSISMTSNCATAWGESVTDAAGTTSYRVRVKSFGTANDLQTFAIVELANVAGPDDIEHVSAKAEGRKVTVRWTLGGAPQSRTLP